MKTYSLSEARIVLVDGLWRLECRGNVTMTSREGFSLGSWSSSVVIDDREGVTQ